MKLSSTLQQQILALAKCFYGNWILCDVANKADYVWILTHLLGFVKNTSAKLEGRKDSLSCFKVKGHTIAAPFCLSRSADRHDTYKTA